MYVTTLFRHRRGARYGGNFPDDSGFCHVVGPGRGAVLRRTSPDGRATVLIGKDTRVSGYMLEASLQAGFSSAGVDVVLCGPIPTPAVAYLTRALRLTAGVVISASHNPFRDNGIKFFSAQGTKLPDAVELEIEAEIDKGFLCEASEGLGKARRLNDAEGRYIEFCKSTFPQGADLRGLKLYLDCANGAAYHVAPAVFHELGADVVADAVNPDGLNINDGVGATHTDDLAIRTAKAGCDYGLAFDGDADRLIMADAEGRLYNGDELLYVIVRDRQRKGKVEGAAGTLMTNYALEQRFARDGIGFVRAKVGDRYVMEELQARGWLFGGESSGHIIALDRQTTGDGIVSALQVLAAVKETGRTLSELMEGLVMMPQVLINKRIERGYDWKANAGFMAAVKDAEAKLAGTGRILIRPSGTEPLLRIMVEAEDRELARATATATADALTL